MRWALLCTVSLAVGCIDLDDAPTACTKDPRRCEAPADSATGSDATLDTGLDGAADATDAPGEATPDADANGDADAAASCDSATCTTAPLARCADGTTRRAYSAPGTCTAGACVYPYVDTTCPVGNICSGGGCSVPPSCAGGITCGTGDSCCTTIPIPGGKYIRSYDGVTSGLSDPRYVATVSDFNLDKYEVSVSRFRKFVDAVSGGWRPTAGSGKHTHLAAGTGLNGGTEAGWDVAWSTHLPSDKASWGNATNLDCEGTEATWTATAGANESKPINCVKWYQAYAFCIWDGGFLPTEAEWNYAAAGGAEQRKYPWGAAAPGADGSHAAYGCLLTGGTCSGLASIASVGSIAAGNGRWGNSDLAGNMWEWNLDAMEGGYHELSCTDCAYLATTPGLARVTRGGAYQSPANELPAGIRSADFPIDSFSHVGLRCARLP